AAPLLVWFYDDPRVFAITLAVAPAAILGGAAVQHQALLRRQMRFGLLAVIGVAAPTIAFVAAIAAALAGLGYWAQVIFVVTVPAASLAGLWIACSWRPGRPVRGAGIRSMLAFGGHRTGVLSITLFIVHFDKILVGRLAGATALGIYAKSYYLFHIPLAQLHHAITSVAATALARLRDDPARYRLFFTRGVKFMAVVNLPAVVFGMIAADRIVLGVLGDQWTEAIPIFRVLGPTVLMTLFAVAIDWVYVSIGHTGRQLAWTIVHAALVVVAMVIGIRHGALGLAIAFSVALVILNPIGVFVCFRGTFLRIRDVVGPIVLPAAAAVLAGAATWAVDRAFVAGVAERQAPAALLVDLAVFGVVYAGALLLLPGGRRLLRETRELSRDLRQREEPPPIEDVEV
ncbi:MAG: oligosaccharide flippase family protein, partial [Planctomycetota bacterium]